MEALDAAARYDDAVEAARDLIIGDPEEPTGHLALGLLLLKQERFEEASAPLGVACDLSPGSPRLHQYAAEAALGAGEFDDAMALANAALEIRAVAPDVMLDPVEAQAPLLIIARRYFKRGAEGDDEKALGYIDEFERATAGIIGGHNSTSIVSPDYAIGEAYLKADRPEEARPYLDGLAPGAPPWAHRAYAETLLRLGSDFDVALREAGLAAGDAGATGADLATLGWAQWKTGDDASAIETLRRALALLPAPSGKARCHYQLSRALEAVGRETEAQEHLALARELGYSVDSQ